MKMDAGLGAGKAKSKPRASTAAKSANAGLMSHSSQIWRSRLSWRILASVFLTILTVQVAILSLTIKNEQQLHLDNLQEMARQTIAPALHANVADYLASPLTQESANRIMGASIVNGMTIYNQSDYRLIAMYGEAPVLQLKTGVSPNQSYYSVDGSFYDVVLSPGQLNRGNGDVYQPYYVVVRLDSKTISALVKNYVYHSLLVMFLLSAFVTTVLMVALSRWLLEPILFMRQNLNNASKNPEEPDLPQSPYNIQDEIGSAIQLAQNLIRQNANNIKQIKSAAQDQIHKLAYYDSLTGLPNRTQFIQKLSELTRGSAGNNGEGEIRRCAVITLDIDHFKDINDTMGHSIGDTVLRALGKRLRTALPESAIVARTGEDEFAVTMLLNGGVTSKDVAEKVQRVIRSDPFKVFNQSFQIRSSIGVATYPDNGIDPDQVLKNADIALNRAKEDGRDTIREYLQDFDRIVQQRFQLMNDLRDALERRELDLFFQPQLDLRTQQVIGAEALIRWWKPDHSKEGGAYISPAVFVPVAEQSGLIVPMGEWVMRHACTKAREWIDRGFDLRVAVNVSGTQFQQSDLVGYTRKVLEETGLPAHHLELEVTESAFMHDVQATIAILNELHQMGVELAIDDFGTGYSSLSYLRQFPIDRLKIDQSFIKNALENPDDAAIARTIVALGHSLNLRVIAEGVETKDQEMFLRSQNCDEVQGYRYSKPVPNEKFLEFVAGYGGDLSSFGT